MTSGKASTMREIADKLKMDRSYLARTLQLANLAPDIVKLIWENRQPETLTLDNLRRGMKAGKSSGSCFYREDTGSLKSKMGSIEFCKLSVCV